MNDTATKFKFLPLVAGVTLALTGCQTTTTGAAGSTAGGGLVDVPVEKCALVAELPVPTDAEVLAVVVDTTASNEALGAAPGLVDQVRAAQRDGLVLQVIGVNGPEGAPIITAPMVLDPRPGNLSPAADEARLLALSCAVRLVTDPAVSAPTFPGSDPLRAILAAFAQNPARVHVDSDGVPTGGVMGMEAIGWDAPTSELLASLTAYYPSPTTPTPITWTSLGHTASPLPPWAADRLQALWAGILPGVDITFDTVVGTTQPATADPLPEDTFTVPQMEVTASGCLTVPAALLFASESTTIDNDATLNDILDAVVAGVAGHPDWLITVEGHTDSLKTLAYRDNLELSTLRAETVAGPIRERVDNPVRATGLGDTRPARQETRPDGTHDTAAAAANRRVTISYGPPDTTIIC